MYYEVELNALGHIWDLLLVKPYRNGGPPVMNWETIRPRVLTEATGPTGGSQAVAAHAYTAALLLTRPGAHHIVVGMAITGGSVAACNDTGRAAAKAAAVYRAFKPPLFVAACAGWRPLSAGVFVDGVVNAAAGSAHWSVELALPWSLLQWAANRRAPPAPGQLWCGAVVRSTRVPSG